MEPIEFNGQESSAESLKTGLIATAKQLLNSMRVVAISQPPDLHFTGAFERIEGLSVSRATVDEWHRPETNLLADLNEKHGVERIESKDLFCNADTCDLKDELGFGYYFDDNHVSATGAALIWAEILEKAK